MSISENDDKPVEYHVEDAHDIKAERQAWLGTNNPAALAIELPSEYVDYEARNIRTEALRAAALTYQSDPGQEPQTVIDTAKAFEAYLRGENNSTLPKTPTA